MMINRNKNSVGITQEIDNISCFNKVSDFLLSLPFVGNKKPIIAALRLYGVIGKISKLQSGISLNNLNDLLEKTFKIKNLSAVCLLINSPGGSPVQAELITEKIKLLSNKTGVPVYSFIEDMATSGGYWLALAGEKIFASKSSIIGSIGVISSGFGFSDAINKLGIERRIYTQGKNKSVLDPFLPINKSDLKIIEEIQKNIHNHFIDFVKKGRGNKLSQNEEIFTGKFWAGEKSLTLGLIDGIDSLNSFIEENYGSEVKIEYIGQKESWVKKQFGIGDHNDVKYFLDNISEMIKEIVAENFKRFF